MNLFKIASLSLLLLFLTSDIVHADVLDSVTAEIGVSTDSVNFGEVVVGDSLLKSIVLYNIGADTISIDSLISTTKSFYSWYQKEGLPSDINLLPNDSINIYITFTPTELIQYVDTVSIFSSDSTIKFYVFGEGITPPSIDISPTFLSISLVQGDSINSSIEISNTGQGDLTYEIDGNLSGFSSGDSIKSIYGSIYAYDEELDQYANHIIEYSLIDGEVIDTIYVERDAPDGNIYSLAQSQTKLYFTNTDINNKIFVYDIASRTKESEIEIATDLLVFNSLSYNGNNESLFAVLTPSFSADNVFLVEIDIETGAFLDTLFIERRDEFEFYSISVNPVENLLYTVSYNQGVIKTFDLLTGEYLGDIASISGSFKRVSYSISRNSLIAHGYDNGYKLFEISPSTGEILNTANFEGDIFLEAISTDESRSPVFEFLSPLSGTVKQDSTREIKFKVKGEVQSSSQLNSEIKITSNDPLNTEIKIPITLIVEGGPEISVYPQSLNLTLGEGETDEESISISNIGNTTLDYSVSIQKRITDQTKEEIFASLVEGDFEHVIRFAIDEGVLVAQDTVLTVVFESLIVRGLSFQKNKLFFSSEYDPSKIKILEKDTGEISDYLTLSDGVSLSSISFSSESMYGIWADYESNSSFVVEVDSLTGSIIDTVSQTESGKPWFTDIAINSNTNELYLLFLDKIEVYDLDTKEKKRVLIEDENYAFQHMSYSAGLDQLLVSGHNFTKPEGSTTGVFILDSSNGSLVDFISFHTEFGSFALDETGIPFYVEFISNNSSSIEPGNTDFFEFKVDAEILEKDEYLSEFIIKSNDRNTPELRVPLNLNILGGSEISISVDSLEFEIMEGDSINASFEISNIGESNLVFDIKSILKEPYESIFKSPTFYVGTGGIKETGQEVSLIVEYSYASNEVLDTVLTLPFGVDYVNSLATDGQRLFLQDSNSSQKILVYDIETGKLVNELQLPVKGETHVYSLSYANGGLFGVVQDTGNDDPNELILVRIDSFNGAFIDTLLTHSSISEVGFLSVSENPYKEVLYIGNNSGEIKVIDTKTGEMLPNLFSSEEYSFFNLSYSASLNSIMAFGRNEEWTETRLFQINVETGFVAKTVDLADFVILAIASNESGFTDYIDFLSANIDTVEGFDSKKIDFKINTKDIYIGEYVSEFLIHSNDIDNPEVKIPFKFTVAQATSDEIEKDIPTELELSQNYPNPFNPTTNITYGLPGAGNVQIKIYNILGQEVMTLVDDFKQAGRYTAVFDARNLSSGMYFYRMMVDGEELEVKKMLLLK